VCKVWLTSVECRRCSKEGKTRNRLKFAGVPQTGKPISASNGPKFTILHERVEEILLFSKFFSVVERYSPTKLCDGAQMAIFCVLYFPASRVQHISDLHSKFALRPHHVWKYGRHPICDR